MLGSYNMGPMQLKASKAKILCKKKTRYEKNAGVNGRLRAVGLKLVGHRLIVVEVLKFKASILVNFCGFLFTLSS